MLMWPDPIFKSDSGRGCGDGRKAVTVQPPLQAADFCRVLHKMSERFSLSKTLKNGSAVMCWHLTCCTLLSCVFVCVRACVRVCVCVPSVAVEQNRVAGCPLLCLPPQSIQAHSLPASPLTCGTLSKVSI